jgi:hypothetical protein
MIDLTITVPGEKAGEMIYFALKIERANFMKVVDMEWSSVEDVLKGEKEGHYIIQK